MYFGTARAGSRPSVSTGLADEIISVSAGDQDAAVRVTLHPDGKFEIDIVDLYGERVRGGHLVAPGEGKKGQRVIKGRLP